MDWAASVRALRARRNLKQEALADMLKVSQAFISRIESGHIEPRDGLKARLRALLNDPANRSVFDQVLAHVRHSPGYVCVLEPRRGAVQLSALSEGLRNEPALGMTEEGALIEPGMGGELGERIRDLLDSGAFRGEVEYIQGLWKSDASGRMRYWRCVATPLRGDDGRWFLHCSNLEIDHAEYEERVKEQGAVAMRPFREPDPAL